ncbi:MAG: hypothetical protein DDG59_02830 [Anaerolineae bacterium]|jgi:hypothetical protein|nr:MAG: hypothetical protein DDG59_02830 [Anaerolineae bacterium]
MDWAKAFTQEIDTAKRARQRGNEGMARVCARRAANVIVQAYLHSMGVQPFRNAMQNFRYLQNHLAANHPAQELLTHFLLKVNEDFTFPNHIDLIQDALDLKEMLPIDEQDLSSAGGTENFPG